MSAEPGRSVHLLEHLGTDRPSGVLWSRESEDLDCNFVSWTSGEGVVEHTNSEVDVLLVCLSGAGIAVIDGVISALQPGTAVVVPKLAPRLIEAGSDGLSYLTCHKRRRRLAPGDARGREAGQASLKNRSGS